MLVEVGQLANWQPKRGRLDNLSSGNIVTGRGIALGSFAGSQAGIVADIEVNKKTGKIMVTHALRAPRRRPHRLPGGVENQIVGSLIRA